MASSLHDVGKQLRVASHTDQVGPGSTFVAINGFSESGAAYIMTALERGATSIVVEQGTQVPFDVLNVLKEKQVELVYVPSCRKVLSSSAAQAYNNPARDLTIVGITGTKGKTTTTYLLDHILRYAGYKTARLGTVDYAIGDEVSPALLTTPQPDFIHAFLAACKEQKVDIVLMEVSAQALSLHRLDDVLFDAGAFTNFSLEHSEFYGSLDEYFAAKCLLFDRMKPQGLMVLNADDTRIASHNHSFGTVHTVGMRTQGTYSGRICSSDVQGVRLAVKAPEQEFVVHAPSLLGEFSGANMLMAIALARRYKVSYEGIYEALKSFEGVPGRLCRYQLPNGAVAVIDTAHTPASFEAFFEAVRPLSNHIVALFGAGGDRDMLKRPLMGELAARYADHVIVTTDNPRSEDPRVIMDQIVKGIPRASSYKVTCELDREQAIYQAYRLTRPGSILVLLGKGCVEYQHIGDQKVPFSEASIVRSLHSC